MAKAKVKTDTPKAVKADIAKNAIIKEFVSQYEFIESREKATLEELSPVFRKVANEMYLSVKVNKIWKSSRALAKAMNKHHSVIQRYVNAGEWLSTRTDEQLAKQGLYAYQAKTQLRKMKTLDAKGASVAKVKNAKAKPKAKNVASCNHGSIDGMSTLVNNFARECKDIAKLQVLRAELVKAIKTIDSKAITTPKGKAYNNLVNA
jgi:hypothetical protein